MKMNSRIITIALLAIAAIMLAVLFVQDKGAGFRIVCFVVPFVAVCMLVVAVLSKLEKKNASIYETRQRMLKKGNGFKMLMMLIPTFALIIAAQQSIYMTDIYNAAIGSVIGVVYGLASYFTAQKFF